MSNFYLLEDLLVLILIRLPPKSLCRFKSVLKSWNLLISSSQFIGFHLQYQSRIEKNIYRLLCNYFVVYNVDDEYSSFHETSLAEYSINGRRDSEKLEIGCEIQRIYNPYDESVALGMTSMLVGSCNGLICQILYRSNLGMCGEYEISLCNPLIKSYWVLPKSPLFLNDGSRRRIGRIIAFYGFGYDDVHESYKVFLASDPPHDEYSCSQPDAKYEYEVYSLRTDKWVIVSSDLDINDYFIRRRDCWNVEGVLINRALHWILTNPYGPSKNRRMHYIVAFDLRADKLQILPLPKDVEDMIMEDEFYYNLLTLSELNGCLLLSHNDNFDMWMMKDYGLRDSWTRIRKYNWSYYRYLLPVALLEDNNRSKLIYHDIRWGFDEGTRLFCFDTKSHQLVEFPTPPSGTFHTSEQLNFVGSLVQPHPPSSGDN